MANIFLEDDINSKEKSKHQGKRIKCKVHIIIASIKDKLTPIGTILVPIDNSSKFSGLVLAAQQRITKNKKYNQYSLDYTPNGLEVFIRDKTDHGLSFNEWAEVDWEDIISDLFDPSTEMIVFKFTNKPIINSNDNKENITCRIFLKCNKQQQDDEKKQEYEKLGNDLNVSVVIQDNSF
eukprot:221739_1